MIFIKLDDLKIRIKDNILNDLVTNDNRILDIAETDAINTIRSYCGKRYDIDFELKRLGDLRNSELVSFITDHIVYDLYTRISVTDINDVREQRFNMLITKLKAASKGEYTPSFKIKDYDYDTNTSISLLSSNTKQNYSW